MTLNLDQVTHILRWLLNIGGPLGAWLVSHGMTPDQVTAFSTSLIAFLGAVLPLVSLIWGLFKHSDAGKLKTIAAMPDEAMSGVTVVVDKMKAPLSLVKAAIDPNKESIITTQVAAQEFAAHGLKAQKAGQ